MTPPKGKQRSIHMDDETFELLQALALKHKANNSTIVRMALAAFHNDPVIYRAATQQPPAPRLDGAVEVPSRAAADTRDIVLPDPNVSSFKVAGDKVIGKRQRSDREDDGLDV